MRLVACGGESAVAIVVRIVGLACDCQERKLVTMGRLLYAKAFVATGEPLANDHLRRLLASSRLSVCATKVLVSEQWQMADCGSLTTL